MTEQRREVFTVPLSAEGYAEANEAFRQCWSADRDEVLAFLKRNVSQDDANHQPRIQILGIGVGDGVFDVRIIEWLRDQTGSTAIDYVAVEPNEVQLQRFQERMVSQDRGSSSFDLRPVRAEDYRPDRGFDLIHYIHSLYHMPGSEERLIGESVAALKPDGVIISALSSERGGIYQMMNHFWNVIDYSHFTTGLFGQESLRDLLDRKRMRYNFEVYPDVSIDVTDCFDQTSVRGQHLLNFLLQADMRLVPPETQAEALAVLAELAPEVNGRNRLSHPSGVFAIPKQ